MISPLVIAHISDLHALSLKGVSPFAFLSHKRLGGAANLLLKRRSKHPLRLFEALVEDLNRVAPDHVVCTGDLVNLSLDAEFAQARALLDRLTLGTSGVTVVPGNHDIYIWASERRKSFANAIGPYASSDGESVPDFPLVRRRAGVSIVGISAARPSPVPFADGRIGAAQLARVEAALAELKDTFRVVLIHHPPFDNRHAFLRGLRDRAELQAVLARVGADLVLHGHEHRDLRTTLAGPAGPIPVIGVGSGTYDDPRPERRARYNLIRIEGRAFTVETRVHDAATNRFVAVADPAVVAGALAATP